MCKLETDQTISKKERNTVCLEKSSQSPCFLAKQNESIVKKNQLRCIAGYWHMKDPIWECPERVTSRQEVVDRDSLFDELIIGYFLLCVNLKITKRCANGT
jgi:hypothetical protein